MGQEISEAGLGPAMKALAPKQRKFVAALLETGGRDHTLAARMAGYGDGGDPSKSNIRVRGFECAHNPKVLAAIREEADRRLQAGLILGASVLTEIAMNPQHKSQLQAALALLDRGGLPLVTQHKVTVEHTHDDEALINRAIEMAKMMGREAGQRFLDQYGIVIDAEFKVIEPLQIETSSNDDSPSTEGLEGIL